MHKMVTLSITEADLIAATSNAQDMKYVKILMESAGVKSGITNGVGIGQLIAFMNNYSVE